MTPEQRGAHLVSALENRIVILDGAMATMIQRRALTESDFRGKRFAAHGHELRGNNDLLVLTRPDVVSEIHAEYLAAGSDIIETNTFGSTAIAQADYGLSPLAHELSFEGARLARRAADAASTADRPRFVAGALGPTRHRLSRSGEVSDRAVRFAEMKAAYVEQARGLVEGGADLLLPETVTDALNLEACLMAIEEVFIERGVRLPVIVSVTVDDRSGRTFAGQTLEEVLTSVAPARPLAVGINCIDAAEMRRQVARLASLATHRLVCCPNAGLPNAAGGYDETPELTGAVIRELAQAGLVNIVGGCCGTTPAHIVAIAAAVVGLAPR